MGKKGWGGEASCQFERVSTFMSRGRDWSSMRHCWMVFTTPYFLTPSTFV